MIYLIKERATKKQIEEMLETLGSYIKLAVDIEMLLLAVENIMLIAKLYCWKMEVSK